MHCQLTSGESKKKKKKCSHGEEVGYSADKKLSNGVPSDAISAEIARTRWPQRTRHALLGSCSCPPSSFFNSVLGKKVLSSPCTCVCTQMDARSLTLLAAVLVLAMKIGHCSNLEGKSNCIFMSLLPFLCTICTVNVLPEDPSPPPHPFQDSSSSNCHTPVL